MAIHGLKAFAVLLSVLLTFSVPFFLPQVTYAECPSCATHGFHGTVSNNGKVVGAGYVVTAVVNGQEMAAATTDTRGNWGVAQPFTVTAPAGSLIEFYVNGVLAGSAASCIETNELNLAVYGAPPPSGSTTSAASSVTNGATSAVPGSAGSQSSSSSTSSDVRASPSTVTFLIGTQPSATHTSPITVDIKCSLPGQQGSLTLSNGVLSSPEELDSAGGAIELDFAANTATNLIAGQQLIVEPATSVSAAPAGSEIVAAYSFEPENVTFSPPITLKLRYDQDKIPAGMEESSLYIAQLAQPGEWVALPSSVDRDDNIVSADISHFSIYGLLGSLPPSSSVITPPAHDSEVLSTPEISPVVEGSLQEGGTMTAPNGAGTATQESGMDLPVLGVLIAGGIMTILVFLAIIRKRHNY